MENSEEQTSLGCQIAVFGILESLVIGGPLYFWLYFRGWSEKPFLPLFPYVIGTLLLLQLGVGLLLRSGKVTQRDYTALSKIILYSWLITLIVPPWVILGTIIF